MNTRLHPFLLSKVIGFGCLLIGGIHQCAAQQIGRLPAELIVNDWLKPPFKVGIVPKGDGSVRELGELKDPGRSTFSSVIADAKELFERNSAIGLLLLDKDGSVVFESYKQGANPNSVMIGYSMAKSATAVAVGQALCDGAIKSLDDAAEAYSDSLKGTAYGQASVRNLLTMASAGKKPEVNGQAVHNLTSDILRHKTKTIRAGFKEFGGGGWWASNRGEFLYKGYDTYALGVILADINKQPAYSYFSKAVWSRVGAQADAAWLLDRDGDTATAEGFGATLRDWGRLALYVRDQSSADKQGCLAGFLREATSKKLNNYTQVNSSSKGYGYQFWTDNTFVSAPAFWMAGYAGQRIAVDPISGRTLVLIANIEDFMPDVYRLFDRFTKS